MPEPKPFAIGLLLFPDMTQLDLTGPYEVFWRMPGAQVHLLWKTIEPVRSFPALAIMPDTSFAKCPPLDLICVPGGPGISAMMEDREVLDFLRRQAATCQYVTSVCTGSLILAAAGLLKGYKATSHWSSIDQLALLGAVPVNERVVVDRNRITGAGVTSGIDFALTVAAQICGADLAQEIQLSMEYDPAPPFVGGSPRSAPSAVVARQKSKLASMLEKRLAVTRRVAETMR
jgi:cyclohexyl-isocyanide hydratase